MLNFLFMATTVNLTLGMYRYADFECGTPSNKALNPDRSLMRLCNPARDGQPKPGSRLSRPRLVRAIEPLENERQIPLRYTDSSISNLGHGVATVCSESDKDGAAGWRVFHGVINQD